MIPVTKDDRYRIHWEDAALCTSHAQERPLANEFHKIVCYPTKLNRQITEHWTHTSPHMILMLFGNASKRLRMNSLNLRFSKQCILKPHGSIGKQEKYS